MKKYLFLSVFAAAALFTACDDDDDYVKHLPAAVEQAFNQKYPGKGNGRWETEAGTYKAEFRTDEGYEAEAWFRPDGTWLRTETDVHPSALPQAVKEYVAKDYPGYYVDDAEYIETPQAAYFHLELEARGQRDVEVNVYADGTPFEGLSGGTVAPGQLPEVIAAAFAERHPGIQVREWEVERGYFKAEFLTADGTEAEAYFTPEGLWVATEYDFKGSLPVAVQSYLAANYAGYRVDDVNYVQTPRGDYYEIELERGQREVRLLVTASGELWEA